VTTVDALDYPSFRGRSSMVEPQPSKLIMPVRSRSAAPWSGPICLTTDDDSSSLVREMSARPGDASPASASASALSRSAVAWKHLGFLGSECQYVHPAVTSANGRSDESLSDRDHRRSELVRRRRCGYEPGLIGPSPRRLHLSPQGELLVSYGLAALAYWGRLVGRLRCQRGCPAPRRTLGRAR
jgi:hypothetical protein